MSSRILLLFTLAALTLVRPASIRAWRLDELTLQRTSTPPVLRLIEPQISADLDADLKLESLTLTNGRARIQTGDQTRWQSPPEWRVVRAQITDLNRDGQPEAALLVWRPFKPWPVDAWLPNGGRIQNFHDANGESCHIILIGWKRDAFRELWAGSALAEPVRDFAAVDLAGDGQQYLITLEGEYDDPPSTPARQLKVWEWNGFGFTVVNELEDSFGLMAIAQTEGGRVLILTD